MYSQIGYADNVIKSKITAYQEVKDAGLWLKQNTNPNDSIITASVYQTEYYSERKVYDFYFNQGDKGSIKINATNRDLPETEEQFDKLILIYKPEFLIVNVFEVGFTPNFAYSWPSKHTPNSTEQVIATPINGYFADPPKNTQPMLIIFRLDYI
jgi:hypothetical protein